MLEKHFTLDRGLPGPDHAASLEADELSDYVREVKAISGALGDGVKRRQPCEEENVSLVRRSWHAVVDLSPGFVIRPNDVDLLRPEGGIAPRDQVIGRTVARFVAAGSQIVESDLARVGR